MVLYRLALSDAILITCVSDEQAFAHEVYQHLYEQLERQRQFEESKDILVSHQHVRLDADNNQIHLDVASHVPKGMIKWILESYLKANPTKFKDYGVIEFGDTFTIGRILHPSQMEMLTCEICGFFTPYSTELYTHRMTHFGI
jgi:hypothetical protein